MPIFVLIYKYTFIYTCMYITEFSPESVSVFPQIKNFCFLNLSWLPSTN